jgi:hypothetical protein
MKRRGVMMQAFNYQEEVPVENEDTETSDVIDISFNIMNGRNVREKLIIKEYKLIPNGALAILDREYLSEMKKSPNHLIFLTALVHTQRLFYYYCCDYFAYPYDPNGEEKLKIWPTKFELDIPKLVTKKKDLVQEMVVHDMVKTKDRHYLAHLNTTIGNTLKFAIETVVILLEDGHEK